MNRETRTTLTAMEVRRYGRQLILPEIGVKGQLSIANARVLVIGAGGLGCPVLTYLAGSGIGCLGVVDDDLVDISNLHRQVLHSEANVGIAKCHSAIESLRRLNSSIDYVSFKTRITHENAIEIIEQFDIVVDASDNVATRYLLNDACVIMNKPLVSGSCLRGEGQLTTYHFDEGPCYRCLFPIPPPGNSVSNCSDVGVVGAIVGIIGSMQAMEVIRIVTGLGSSWSQKMVLVDGFDGNIKTIKLRPRRKDCVVCGQSPTITKLIDYEEFCGSKACDLTQSINILPRHQRLSCEEYQQMIKHENDHQQHHDSTEQTTTTIDMTRSRHLLIDTRPKTQFEICSLPNAVNVPFDCIIANHPKLPEVGNNVERVVVVCRRGNDSQIAVGRFKEMQIFPDADIFDVIGGLEAWSKDVDADFPFY